MMQFRVRSIRLRNVFSVAMLPLLGFACAIFATGTAAQDKAATATAPTIESATTNLKMRAIGPAIMGGRIDDFAVVETRSGRRSTGRGGGRRVEIGGRRHDVEIGVG